MVEESMIVGRPTCLLVAALLQTGCYNYLALRRGGLVPASYVAVTLTESGSDELGPYLGPDALVVRGRYLGPTDRGLSLSVESVESRRGDIARWTGETVVVRGEFVRRVEERHAAGSKTVLLAGAAVAGLVVVYQAFGQSNSGGVAAGTGMSTPH
jgi:hypothetical protein